MIVDIVLGCSFGDEGKGKVVFDLLQKNNYQLCVRFNGSGNAGHTIYKNGRKFVVHQLPVGILHETTFNLISSDCLVDISRLQKEIETLQNQGIDIQNRLFISKACHIITPECIEYDRANNKIGTTGSGKGPTFSHKMLRIGKRVEDMKEELEKMGIQIVDMRKFWNSYFIQTHVHSILLEGAQGFELDINWTNNYPYCTSSTCTLAGAINTGISIGDIRNIIGVSKIYDTYVGTMKFQPEEDEDLVKIGDLGMEYGSTTGRRRQCNYLNLDNLVEALQINQCTHCVINKVDIVQELNIYKLYHLGTLIRFDTWEDMKNHIIKTLQSVEVIFSSNPYEI